MLAQGAICRSFVSCVYLNSEKAAPTTLINRGILRPSSASGDDSLLARHAVANDVDVEAELQQVQACLREERGGEAVKACRREKKLRASRSAAVSLVPCDVARGHHLVTTPVEHERHMKIVLDTAVADRKGIGEAHQKEIRRA